jgi:hypothetical protein
MESCEPSVLNDNDSAAFTRKVAPMRWFGTWVVSLAFGTCAALVSNSACAQAAPERSEGWSTATNVMAISALGVELVFPRIFYSDPEVVVGWKARWHLSVLAPTMTITTLALFNEQVLKKEIGGYRPGCNEDTQGGPGCTTYGMLSTQSFAASAAFGQGLGTFIVDTVKWSGGQFSFGAFTANTAVPGILAVITTAGRGAGNWENAGQAWSSAGIGMLTGLGLGVLYATMQRPECGYTGNLICW